MPSNHESTASGGQIPAMPGKPLLGNVTDLVTTQIRGFLTKGYQKHGPVFSVRALGEKFIVLAGPEANLFTVKEGHKVMRSLEAWRKNDQEFGADRSMISVEGEMHRTYRKAEGRAYSRSYFASHLRPAAAVVAEDLYPFVAGDLLPVAKWSKQVVTEQLARTVVSGTARPYLADMLIYIQQSLMVNVTKQLPPIALKNPRYQQAKARVLNMVDDLVTEHQLHPPEQTGREPDLIDDVIAAQRLDPDFWQAEDVRFAALGAFIAGMDTAANSLAFVLYRLHHHRDLLPAVVAEADQLFANGLPTAEALGRAQSLHHFVMETLRLHPIAPAINRTLIKDCHFAGHDLKSGSKLIIGTTVSHGLERFYPDPERFDPERFAPARAEHRQPGAYAPFGLGVHTCAGSSMAEGLIMLNTAATLYTLELELDPRYRLREIARPTPSPDERFLLNVKRVRHAPVTLLA